MIQYKCDKCEKEHKLVEENIIEMESYISPNSCFGGDYYTHDHYFFYCVCTRPIEVRKQDVKNLYTHPKINKMHGNGRCSTKYKLI